MTTSTLRTSREAAAAMFRVLARSYERDGNGPVADAFWSAADELDPPEADPSP